MVNFSILTFVGFLYLLTTHTLDLDGKYDDWCDGFYPCSFLYSRFESKR
jgi:hypothetical protein